MSNRKIKVVCTHASGVGLVAATDLTTKLIREFHPRVVVMTGFCGGVGVAIGDLVVAEKAWDWQMGKHVPGAFLSGVDQKEGSPELIALSRGLEGDLGELVEESVAIELPAPITLHVAPMVSGSAVVSDSSLHGVLKAQHRKVAAVDMEAYGVYFAAQMAEAPVPKVICVKGVADLADVDKADNAQAFCSSLSARFAWKLLEKVFSE